jgi:hypothetical protein
VLAALPFTAADDGVALGGQNVMVRTRRSAGPRASRAMLAPLRSVYRRSAVGEFADAVV